MTERRHDFAGGSSQTCLRCEAKIWNRNRTPCIKWGPCPECGVGMPADQLERHLELTGYHEATREETS